MFFGGRGRGGKCPTPMPLGASAGGIYDDQYNVISPQTSHHSLPNKSTQPPSLPLLGYIYMLTTPLPPLHQLQFLKSPKLLRHLFWGRTQQAYFSTHTHTHPTHTPLSKVFFKTLSIYTAHTAFCTIKLQILLQAEVKIFVINLKKFYSWNVLFVDKVII